MKRILSVFLAIVLVFYTNTSVLAESNYLVNVRENYEIVNHVRQVESAAKIYESLGNNEKRLFEDYLSRDPELLRFHKQFIKQESFVDNSNFQSITRYNKVNRSNPLDILAAELSLLAIPVAVRYSLMGVGVGIVAAPADGPIVIGDLLLLATVVVAAASIAVYWDEVSANWSGIERAFKKSFSSVFNNIGDFLSGFKAKIIKENNEIQKIKNEIPNKLKNKKGDVDLSKFRTRVGKGDNTAFREDVTGNGWVIQKDKAVNSGSGSHASEWKLKTKKQYESRKGRVATLNGEGKVLRK